VRRRTTSTKRFREQARKLRRDDKARRHAERRAAREAGPGATLSEGTPESTENEGLMAEPVETSPAGRVEGEPVGSEAGSEGAEESSGEGEDPPAGRGQEQNAVRIQAQELPAFREDRP